MKNFKDLIGKRWFANAVAGCITVAFYIILSNINDVWSGITQFISYFSTAIGGCVLAYLMNPLAKLYQRTVFSRIRNESARWTASIVVSVTTVVLFLVVIMSILIPQLFDSIVTFISNLDSYAATLQDFIHKLGPKDDESTSFQNFVISSDNIINTVVDYIVDNSSKIINISTTAGKSVINWVIAFILSVYLLSSKQKLKSGSIRFLRASLSKEHFDDVTSFLSHCNSILNRYVIFDLLDGLIVGTVNAVFMSLCGMQYVGLVSVVVGITNLIPTFGPLVGAIIGGFILLMVKPFYALIFIIFTICLQFVDGYILKPKLFGNTLGVPGLWILIVILVGSRVYGVIGILLAIPIAAITDYIYHEHIIKSMEEHSRNAEQDAEEEPDPPDPDDDEPDDVPETVPAVKKIKNHKK
ncbi:MAG TPA: AI-2E family transporter [Ruminococcus sp.]|nr:AI-2E family transporter [Ruminococcus sp.]